MSSESSSRAAGFQISDQRVAQRKVLRMAPQPTLVESGKEFPSTISAPNQPVTKITLAQARGREHSEPEVGWLDKNPVHPFVGEVGRNGIEQNRSQGQVVRAVEFKVDISIVCGN
jgi:hypothetical protein